MPELPEVETIKRGLKRNIKGKKIADFECDYKKMINHPLPKYKKTIKGLEIKDVKRRAKLIILDLSKNKNILIHLKLTGQLVFDGKAKCIVGGHPIEEGFDCLPNKYTHAIFTFADKTQLYYNDIRKFGWLKLFTDEELEEKLEEMNLGPEPLDKDFTLDAFKKILEKNSRSKIKQLLMDQKEIAGIGNIYSDEICYYAKVKPTRKAGDLSDKEIKLLYKGIKEILRDSIKAQGTSFRNYVNAKGDAGAYTDKLKVYGRYGSKCKKCGTKIKKVKVGGRTSSYCPKCQK